ncbi:hypothetical protein AVEN_260894-1 [Araneus ventricosus]|uniref:Uncharacterized protein n=1 Tax=Araneus ventricosus TaxID=182803 RepID=A0A4Y2HDW0_ARAVE|nr:hypothetical protein AVEN_260894-1 [Araneus ventricosus]
MLVSNFQALETGLRTIKEVPEVRKNAISWLKQKRMAVLGWREDNPRAVVALYLASAASFNGTVLEEEFMAKQTEFVTAIALLRPSLTNSELSMFIHALLVTCHNPRHFYGNNLVKRLKEQVEEAGNFTHPLDYLALCNANESWPLRASSDLNSILSSNSEYPFVKEHDHSHDGGRDRYQFEEGNDIGICSLLQSDNDNVRLHQHGPGFR